LCLSPTAKLVFLKLGINIFVQMLCFSGCNWSN
jgi:hypothetical protein